MRWISLACLALWLGVASPAAGASDPHAAATDAHAVDTHAVDTHAGAAYAGGHGPESSGGLLSFDVGSYLWKIIIFTLFFLALAKFVWPPILKGLQAREQKMASDLRGAEDARRQAQASLDELTARLTQAHKEAAAIAEQARADAARLRAEMTRQTEAEIATLRDRATAEIEAARRQAVADLYTHVADLSTQIAGRILQREIRSDDQRALVDRSLQELTKQVN